MSVWGVRRVAVPICKMRVGGRPEPAIFNYQPWQRGVSGGVPGKRSPLVGWSGALLSLAAGVEPSGRCPLTAVLQDADSANNSAGPTTGLQASVPDLAEAVELVFVTDLAVFFKGFNLCPRDSQ